MITQTGGSKFDIFCPKVEDLLFICLRQKSKTCKIFPANFVADKGKGAIGIFRVLPCASFSERPRFEEEARESSCKTFIIMKSQGAHTSGVSVCVFKI